MGKLQFDMFSELMTCPCVRHQSACAALLLVFYLIFYSTKRFFSSADIISSKDRHNSNQHLRPRPFHFYGGAGAPHSAFRMHVAVSEKGTAQGEKIVLFLLLAIVKFFYCRTEKPMPCALNIAFNSNNNNNGAKSDMIFYTPAEGDPA